MLLNNSHGCICAYSHTCKEAASAGSLLARPEVLCFSRDCCVALLGDAQLACLSSSRREELLWWLERMSGSVVPLQLPFCRAVSATMNTLIRNPKHRYNCLLRCYSAHI